MGLQPAPKSLYYTYTIRNSKSNFEHERIYTAPSRDQQLETYNNNNFQTNIAYAQYGCAMTEGQDSPDSKSGPPMGFPLLIQMHQGCHLSIRLSFHW